MPTLNPKCVCDDGYDDAYGCYTCINYTPALDAWIKERIQGSHFFYNESPELRRTVVIAKVANLAFLEHHYQRNPAYYW
jgi:hypothetical protein